MSEPCKVCFPNVVNIRYPDQEPFTEFYTCTKCGKTVELKLVFDCATAAQKEQE